MAILNVSPLIGNTLGNVGREYIQNPISTDLKINSYVISKIGPPPVTPLSYFQRCGNAFWWPQTCEYRERVRAEVTAARNTYNIRYQAERAVLLNGVLNTLKADPDKETLKASFKRGEVVLQNAINAEMKKIESLAKFENTAWTIFSVAATGLSVATGNKLIIGATAFAINLLRDLSSTLNVDVASLHRFSEEPPGVSDKTLTTRGLQWDNARIIITYVEIGKELETMYTALFPTANQTITKNAGSVALFALGGLLVRKYLKNRKEA